MARNTSRRRFLKTTAVVGAGYWALGGIAPARAGRPMKRFNSPASASAAREPATRKTPAAPATWSPSATSTTRTSTRPPASLAEREEVQRLPQDVRRDGEEHRRLHRQHARPLPRRRRVDGHEAGQARLRAEAADAFALRSPLPGQAGRGEEGRHADGQPRHGEQRPPRGRGDHQERRTRHGEGSPRLDEPPDLARKASIGPDDTPEVPANVHWAEWIGPAEMRPYNPAYHPFKWRGWWEFGTGALGDMACHTLNMPYMALICATRPACRP